ncbi:MAG: sodium-dependent transporter [Thermanaerothrix sp.]|nr:sodium-dependent transporter [Thermanaerothrix sp.]
MEGRETFSSKLGFVLACVGAAMGLGSIWLFPWRLGAFGGAAFLIPYLAFTFGLAVTGLMGEFAFGRSQKAGAVRAFGKVLSERGFRFGGALGLIPVLGVSGVFVFYLIVCGWVLKYLVLSVMGAFSRMDPAAYFQAFAGSWESVLWHLAAMVLTMLIIARGVQGGIESSNKVMMPALFLILLALMARSLTLPGAMKGVEFLLLPKWHHLMDPKTWVMALGMAFFTVCLGGAAMLVYGSYLKDGEDIPSSAMNTAFWTTVASILSALVTIPAAFAFGLDVNAGPSLLFITVPHIFGSMPGGYVFGILFFLCVLFAAISSAINLMEVPVEAVMDGFGLSRKASSMAVAAAGFLLGVPMAVNLDLFGTFADTVTTYVVPFGAVLSAVVFFWFYGADRARQEVNMGARKKLGAWWSFHAKYVFVLTSVAVLVLGIVMGGF